MASYTEQIRNQFIRRNTKAIEGGYVREIDSALIERIKAGLSYVNQARLDAALGLQRLADELLEEANDLALQDEPQIESAVADLEAQIKSLVEAINLGQYLALVEAVALEVYPTNQSLDAEWERAFSADLSALPSFAPIADDYDYDK